MKNKKEIKLLEEEIEIPSEINANLNNNYEIIMEKGNDKIIKKLNPKIEIFLEGNKIKLLSRKTTKRERKIFGSIKSHIKNMISGLNEKFKYKLQVASVHFPITVLQDKEKNELSIKNFLGEKKDRRVKILNSVHIKINKDIIEIESADIEKAGQVAANIEKITKIRNRDRRVFQDGIYIIEKPGRIFLG